MSGQECWNCGHLNPEQARRCEKCGQALISYGSRQTHHQTEEPKTGIQKPAAEKARLCPHCQTINNERAWTCTQCGQTLSVDSLIEVFNHIFEQQPQASAEEVPTVGPDPKYCWNCGKPIMPLAKFCQHCGTKLYPQADQQEKNPPPEPAASRSSPPININPPVPRPVDTPPQIQPGPGLSTLQRFYCWANIIINPVLIIWLLATDAKETASGYIIGWAIISGLLNPRIQGSVTSILVEGCGPLVTLFFESCYVILFGGMAALIFMAVLAAFTAFCIVGAFSLILVALFIDALLVLLSEDQ